MSGWVRLENATPDAIDRKTMERGVSSLSDKAFRLWFNAICFCSRAETDGHVPADGILMLSRTATRKVVGELVGAGLLHADGAAYVVHDYLEHNPSRQRISEMREQGRKRVENHRRNGVTDVVTEDVTSGVVTPLPPARERVRSVSSSYPTTTNDQSQGAATDALPSGFPDELAAHLDAVDAVLSDLAERQHSKAVSRLSLASVIAARPHKPVVRAARDFAAWADGKAQPRRDVVAGYRNWLDRTDDLAATELLGDAGETGLVPLPSRPADPYEQRRAERAAALAAARKEQQL